MANQEIRAQLQDVAEKLRDPWRLRLLMTVIALAIGYMGLYCTFDSEIRIAKRKLSEEEKRGELADEVQHLQEQLALIEDRLQKDSDVNEWVQYVLQGVRDHPLKLKNLDVKEERKVGPYRAIELRLNVSGAMRDLDELVAWLETNDRIFRIDTFSLIPSKLHVKHRTLELTLLALKA